MIRLPLERVFLPCNVQLVVVHLLGSENRACVCFGILMEVRVEEEELDWESSLAVDMGPQFAAIISFIICISAIGVESTRDFKDSRHIL
jgi:hypothetical protein